MWESAVGAHCSGLVYMLLDVERRAPRAIKWAKSGLTFCVYVFLIIPDLDECNLVSILAIEVIPALIGRVSDADGLTLEVILMLEYVGRMDVGIPQAAAIHCGQRPFFDWSAKRPPDTDEGVRLSVCDVLDISS